MSWETPPSFFRGLSLKDLGTDEAYLNISSSSASPFYLYTLSDDCDLCPWQRESEVGAVGRLLKKVHAHHPLRLLGVIGAVLCGGSQNGGWVPLNKNLWSISFVLVTSCFAFVLLSLLYLVIDVKKWWKGQPFFYAGMNSILLYCGHSVGYNLFPWHFISGDMRLHAERLPEALWGTSLWVFIAFVLYKKKVFVTV